LTELGDDIQRISGLEHIYKRTDVHKGQKKLFMKVAKLNDRVFYLAVTFFVDIEYSLPDCYKKWLKKCNSPGTIRKTSRDMVLKTKNSEHPIASICVYSGLHGPEYTVCKNAVCLRILGV